MREAEVLERLVAWGEAHPTVLAMILTSSRARPDAAVDILSDYDLILVVTEPDRFAEDRAWESDFGEPMVRWGDQTEVCGLTTYFRGLVYADGTKIDYTIWPEALLDRIAEEPVLPDMLDVGYRVLLDKDGRASSWKPPTYRAHIPAKPTELEYRDLVEEFWWSMTYVAKSLWRDELVFNRFVLEQDIRAGTLRQMLDWRIEIDHDWSLKPGWYGRGLKQFAASGDVVGARAHVRRAGQRGELGCALPPDGAVPAGGSRSRRAAWLRLPAEGRRPGDRLPGRRAQAALAHGPRERDHLHVPRARLAERRGRGGDRGSRRVDVVDERELRGRAFGRR